MPFSHADLFSYLSEKLMRFIWRETRFPVIICDRNGVIIKAVETDRIGDTHAGAVKILRGEADEYAATAEEAAQNPLVKEGYSCPIEIDGVRAGTFGITGELALSKPLARLSAKILGTWVKEHEQHRLFRKTSEDLFSHIDRLVDKTRQVDEKFRGIIGRIEGASVRASERMDTTDQILDRVYRISQQSHILSVNGSVEAARAGGEGLGFAVVAQEMTRLARDTKQTAEEIQDRLSAIRQAIREVSGAVVQSLDIADAHQTDIEDMKRMIATLRDSVTGLSDLFEE